MIKIISKYKTIFANMCTPNRSQESFVIEVINTLPEAFEIENFNGKEIFETSYKKQL